MYNFCYFLWISAQLILYFCIFTYLYCYCGACVRVCIPLQLTKFGKADDKKWIEFSLMRLFDVDVNLDMNVVSLLDTECNGMDCIKYFIQILFAAHFFVHLLAFHDVWPLQSVVLCVSTLVTFCKSNFRTSNSISSISYTKYIFLARENWFVHWKLIIYRISMIGKLLGKNYMQVFCKPAIWLRSSRPKMLCFRLPSFSPSLPLYLFLFLLISIKFAGVEETIGHFSRKRITKSCVRIFIWWFLMAFEYMRATTRRSEKSKNVDYIV